jgi:hypothetical protein
MSVAVLRVEGPRAGSGVSGGGCINLSGDPFPRATVEQALGRLLLQRVERLEPIDRITRSRLEWEFTVNGVRYRCHIWVVAR